jgi:FAD:protein FMN transferase
VLGPDKALEIYNRLDDIDAIIVKLDGTVVHSSGMSRAPPHGDVPAAAAH